MTTTRRCTSRTARGVTANSSRRRSGGPRSSRPATAEDSPPHVGVLLDNTPEYIFWLAAAALSGSVVVGINSTYRGEQLGQLISHTDCEVIVTSSEHLPLLEGAGAAVSPEQLLVVDGPDYPDVLAEAVPSELPAGGRGRPLPPDLHLGFDRVAQGGALHAGPLCPDRIPRVGHHRRDARRRRLLPTPVLPLVVPVLGLGGRVDRRRTDRHPATLLRVRRRCPTSGATGRRMLTYTGKVLNYILAVPESPDDAENTLRLALGNEASMADIREFSRRFDCTVRDSYGSTEGMIIIRRDPSMPEGALGQASESVKVMDAETLRECPPIRVVDGRIANFEEAVGEIVETGPTSGFEGYYNNPEATQTRFRNGWYWSGDLGYRDGDGWFYFAGRSNEWLRVDGENFAAAPVEAIIARYPAIRSAAVYAVPDDPVGDRVMAALEVWDGDGVRSRRVR